MCIIQFFLWMLFFICQHLFFSTTNISSIYMFMQIFTYLDMSFILQFWIDIPYIIKIFFLCQNKKKWGFIIQLKTVHFSVWIKNSLSDYTHCMIRITKWVHQLHQWYLFTNIIQNIKNAYFIVTIYKVETACLSFSFCQI